jgi:hypothetical protein
MTTRAVRTASQLRTIARETFSTLIRLDHSIDLTRIWGGSDTTFSRFASTPVWRRKRVGGCAAAKSLIAQKVARVGGFGTIDGVSWISKLVSGASIRMLDPPGLGGSPMFEGKHPSIRGVFFVLAQKVARLRWER